MKLLVGIAMLCWSVLAFAANEKCEIQGRLAAVTTMHKSKGWTKEQVVADLKAYLDTQPGTLEAGKQNVLTFVARVYDEVATTDKPSQMDSKYYMLCVIQPETNK